MSTLAEPSARLRHFWSLLYETYTFFAFIAFAFASLSFAGKPGKDNLRVLYWNIQ